MEVKFIGSDGNSGQLSVSDSVFGREYNEALVHQIVTAYFANARQGTRAQKGRSDVAKSRHKLWRQKGTGRARVGAASNPIWRGGGKVFPNSPDENFSHKVNRKMYRSGMCAILSKLLSEDRLKIVEKFSIESAKTKDFVNKLKSLNLTNVLIVTEDIDDNLYLSSRNVPTVTITDAMHIDPVSLLKHHHILISREAAMKLEEMLK